MTIEVLFLGIGMLLILEGLLPAIAPKLYQAFLKEILKAKPQSLRYFGIGMMIIGLLVVVTLS